jgi:hypothetical protein
MGERDEGSEEAVLVGCPLHIGALAVLGLASAGGHEGAVPLSVTVSKIETAHKIISRNCEELFLSTTERNVR